MLRDKNLIPLSHQHQHALALCVRIDRSLQAGGKAEDWNDEIARAFDTEIQYHFAAEEQILFPACEKYEPLKLLIKQLLAEHVTLRGFFAMAAAKTMDVRQLATFHQSLSQHIRTEERELFEQSQRLMPQPEMDALGAAMQRYFETSGMPGAACDIRSEA
ncbi:MAG TPA: hemerythrin domain-containing protein [Terriglobales bacterium]|nr:hemerythrin domain-containing protein [Terriglobales bacterium]